MEILQLEIIGSSYNEFYTSSIWCGFWYMIDHFTPKDLCIPKNRIHYGFFHVTTA